MVSTVKKGTINMPKLLRHMSSRTNNIREVLFQRDPVYNKSTKTTKVGGADLKGPAVNFGYEASTNTSQDGKEAGGDDDTVYHLSTPELVICLLYTSPSPRDS